MKNSAANRWQLPDGVNELLPEQAWRVEALRRRLIDNSALWGYELVMPPLIEYLDSLLTGTGETLDLQTFKFIDQYNGRSLGVRADMTPQVARIDAHAMHSALPNRLFYIGSVLRARSDGAGDSRTPLQFGAELFGHAGPDSDAEIILMMMDHVMSAGIECSSLLLDMGHVGVYRTIIDMAKADSDFDHSVEVALFDALLRGSWPEVSAIAESSQNNPSERLLAKRLLTLLQLSGPALDVLDQARGQLHAADSAISKALSNLQTVVETVNSACPELDIHIDLSELRGFRYHTGTLFTLYGREGRELARGGRYDAIGEAFGRSRCATGFSGDLVNLALTSINGEKAVENAVKVSSGPMDDCSISYGHDSMSYPARSGVWVERPFHETGWQTVRQLRRSGERVVMSLPGSAMRAEDAHCDRHLVYRDGAWVVEPIAPR